MALKTAGFSWSGFRLLICVLVCFTICTCRAKAVENQLLKIIHSFDSIYEKGVSSSGNHLETRPSQQRGVEQIVDEEWAFTQSEHQKAILKTARSVPECISYGEGMPLRRYAFHRTIFLSDQKRLGTKSMNFQQSVPLQEYATSQDVSFASLNLFAPDSNTLSYRLGLFLIAMGRGIASKINVLDAVNKSVDWSGEECILIEGQGGSFLGGQGTWKVYVLPNAAYMVRHAQYLYDGVVRIEVETLGLICKNDCYYPEKSEIKILRGDPYNTNHKFIFFDAKLEFDSNLFERVSQDFDSEMPKDSEIIDSSSGKTVVQIIGGAEPEESYELHPRPFFTARTIFIIVFNVVGIALLIYLYYRSRKLKTESS